MKILIVDDSRFTRKIEGKMIKEKVKDVEIYYANDGDMGFEKYKEINPDYTIIDLLMPKMSGKELIKKIKNYDVDAKLIVVTADVQEKVKKEVLELGVLKVVNKPLNEGKINELVEVMRMC